MFLFKTLGLGLGLRSNKGPRLQESACMVPKMQKLMLTDHGTLIIIIASPLLFTVSTASIFIFVAQFQKLINYHQSTRLHPSQWDTNVYNLNLPLALTGVDGSAAVQLTSRGGCLSKRKKHLVVAEATSSASEFSSKQDSTRFMILLHLSSIDWGKS